MAHYVIFKTFHVNLILYLQHAVWINFRNKVNFIIILYF